MSFQKPLRGKARWRAYQRLPAICASCGTADDLTIDHSLARSLGGTNAFTNLQRLCYACNQAKSVVEYAQLLTLRREMLVKTMPSFPPVPNLYHNDGHRRDCWARLMRDDE